MSNVKKYHVNIMYISYEEGDSITSEHENGVT